MPVCPKIVAPLVLAGLLSAVTPGRVDAQVAHDPFMTVAGIPNVVNGDLVAVGGREVRLYAIDAPEPGQICRSADRREFDCGASATAALEAVIGAQEVECTVYSSPLTGPAMVGRCRAGGVDLGEAMVVRGWAYAMPSLSHRYGRAQAIAQARQRGVWAGVNQPPWVWRANRR